MKKLILMFARYLTAFLAVPILFFYSVAIGLLKQHRDLPRLMWGVEPILNYKYWSMAMLKAGFDSKTFMFLNQSFIQNGQDYDISIYELMPNYKFKLYVIVRDLLIPYVAFIWALNRFDILHASFLGGILWATPLNFFESWLLKLAQKKIILLSFGGDAYMYSRIVDRSWLHGLLTHYPFLALQESSILNRVQYWSQHADILIGSSMCIDVQGRWDILSNNTLTIDTSTWYPKKKYSEFNGLNGSVRIIHTPNHRTIKGTDFLLKAIDELKSEGLKIDLILMEKIPNVEVLRVMQNEADILVEQLILGYGLSGVEGMACGLPVISNLSNEIYTRFLRRFTCLNECPILSATPENIKDNLRLLITCPKLRKELGVAGRQYVEKYHSEATAQYMFGAIYDKIWFKKDINLMNLFHPLLSEFNRRTPPVLHPLVDNELPSSYSLN